LAGDGAVDVAEWNRRDQGWVITVGMGIMMPIGIDLASVDHKKVCKENCQSSLGRIGPLQFVLQLGNSHLL
jgi:hypothetical protein